MLRVLALSFATLIASWPAFATSEVRGGDIISHTSRSAQSAAIQRATGARFSHMGVILFWNREPYVFEAGKTVRCTPLAIQIGELQRLRDFNLTDLAVRAEMR